MLFNSYAFILGFAPVTFLVFFALGPRIPRRAALGWLALCSLFFYGWWKPAYLGLMLFSILFNFVTGQIAGGRYGGGRIFRKTALTAGVVVNLGLLGYFKYVNFLVDQFNVLLPMPVHLAPVVLPLAISFFTFQQIAFLVDTYRGLAREVHFIDYCLFVSFFPQLIAGPIVHHAEMMPQFATSDHRLRARNVAVGLTYFFFGLFKKVVLADTFALFATPVFSAAGAGGAPTLLEAWGGALAYAFQIYFDFSGYSDMAIGLGWMLGIRLPVNFHSPYKAAGIVDFWRRWHMTLSRFLRDYLYIPLGGNRKGPSRRVVNLMMTMLLGGLWHGAGWTFVLWGGLHGLYLIINHGWHRVRRICGWTGTHLIARGASVVLTFVAVVIGWVLFRAESVTTAAVMLRGMAGLHGVSVSGGLADSPLSFLAVWGVSFNGMASFDSEGLKWIAAGLAICWGLPNSQEIMMREPWTRWQERIRWCPAWRASFAWGAAVGILALAALQRLEEVSEFLYFQF